MRVFLSGVGVIGPGLPNWPSARGVLRGEADYVPEPPVLEAPDILSPRERRRSSPAIRLALGAAQEATERSGLPADDLATVFGSSNGNCTEIHNILESLATPEMLISPTRFHNSVHNSAVGYWCIAKGCHAPSTSVSSHDYTFPAALLKAAAQAVCEERPVLLNVYDHPYPKPLASKRHVGAPFAGAFAVSPEPASASLAEITLSWQAGAPPGGPIPEMAAPLGELAASNPAARMLPLLEAIALETPATIALGYPRNGSLQIAVAPC